VVKKFAKPQKDCMKKITKQSKTVGLRAFGIIRYVLTDSCGERIIPLILEDWD